MVRRGFVPRCPPPPPLRRAYAVVPGQSDEEHREMCDRLDLENARIGLATSLPAPSTTPTTTPEPMAQTASGKSAAAAILAPHLDPDENPEDFIAPDQDDFAPAPTPAPKRSLDDVAPAPKAKRKRKPRITAVEKMIGGETIYELTLPDGSIVLTRPLKFA